MAKEKKDGVGSDWDEGDAPNQDAPSQAANNSSSPASPQVPGSRGAGLDFPPNASRDDIIRIKASAEAALKKNPDYEIAKSILAEANERLRYFTPSGLPVPRQAQQPDHDDDQPSETEHNFPSTAKEARELHAKIKSERVRTIRQRDEKVAKLHALSAHIARLENGLPTIHIGADDHAKTYELRNAGLKRQKLILLGRQIPEVKSLLAERDAFEKTVEDLNAVNTAAAQENAALKAELKKFKS